MEALKMTKKEMEVLDMLDRFIHSWEERKPNPLPPEIHLFRKDGKLFDSVCKKVENGLPERRINPTNKTYRGVPIRCQY